MAKPERLLRALGDNTAQTVKPHGRDRQNASTLTVTNGVSPRLSLSTATHCVVLRHRNLADFAVSSYAGTRPPRVMSLSGSGFT